MNLSQLVREVQSIGGTLLVQHSGRRTDVTVDSPGGMIWDANGCHVLVSGWNGSPTRPTWKQEKTEALADVQDRIGYGVSECTDPDCEYCHDE